MNDKRFDEIEEFSNIVDNKFVTMDKHTKKWWEVWK